MKAHLLIDPVRGMTAGSFLAAMLRDRPDQWQEQQFDDGRSALFVRLPSGE